MITPAEYLAQVDSLRRAMRDEQTREILTRFCGDKEKRYRDEAITESLKPEPNLINVVRSSAKMEVWRDMLLELDYLTQV